MGSFIEINDTLQITTEQGFPSDVLDLDKHSKHPITLNSISDDNREFRFKDKKNARIYHSPPTRIFLVHNIDGKWLYWGHAMMVEQSIDSRDEDNKTTSGRARIVKVYDPEYQKQITMNESPKGKSYFPLESTENISSSSA